MGKSIESLSQAAQRYKRDQMNGRRFRTRTQSISLDQAAEMALGSASESAQTVRAATDQPGVILRKKKDEFAVG